MDVLFPFLRGGFAPPPKKTEYISHIGGGDHPANFTVVGKTLCEACWRRHGRKGAGEALVIRGPTLTFPQRHRTSSVNN